MKLHSNRSETGTPCTPPPGLKATLTRCSTILSSRRRIVSGPVIILSKTKRCAASMVNPKRINRCLLRSSFTRSSMGVGPVKPLLAVLVSPLPSAEAPGTLVSLTVLLPSACAPMVLVSAALGSPFSWGYSSVCIPSWTEYSYLSSSVFFWLGLLAAFSTSGISFPAEPLIAYLCPPIHCNCLPGVLASKRRPPYSGQYSQ